MDLRELIIYYRAKYRLSQEKFAELVGLNPTTIHNIECDKHEPWETTKSIIMGFLREEKEKGRFNF